ncbi:Ribosomal lysine N-methyltransferase 4 [Cladophialophora chaetospira]|uniref:Ribosomal lysine N-methyltransferase 4 n=1 Tax=Cladophialophora chaetospira TaxID=386627 RepID=A0AA38X8Q3_9EURO|nr:Ribosomal lysine N-methyltransferase 4 [Cladophialophora chaetospira]
MAEPVEHVENHPFNEATTEFVEWFKSADGIRLSPKVELRDLRNDNAGRGAVASQNIEEDEELFAIPRSLVLTTTTSVIPPAVLEPLNETGSWPPLIFTIVYEYLRGETSPWHPYFQVLPRTFNSLMYWQDTELETLQASAVIDKIGREQAEESWKETIIPLMLSHPDLFPVAAQNDLDKTTELIRLAHMAGSLIMAYAFDIDRDQEASGNKNGSHDEFEEDDEDEPLKGMVPFADMLNADADRNNVLSPALIPYETGFTDYLPLQARLFQETDYLIMKATKPISTGEQIFNDYGPLPRSDLLRMYGYITDEYAQYDVVEISHDLLLEVAGKKHGAKDTAWLKREAQLEELGIIDDGYAVPRPAKDVHALEDAIPGQLHMLLRGLCIEAIQKPKDAITIEEAALLQSVLTKRLSEYATSLQADESALQLFSAKPDQSVIPPGCSRHRYSMALRVRIGEKQILHQLIDLCQSHISKKTEAIAAASTKRPANNDPASRRKKVARKG